MESEEEFEERVRRLIELANGPDPARSVGLVLQSFEEEAYLRGQYSLIDILRRELNKHDLRLSD